MTRRGHHPTCFPTALPALIEESALADRWAVSTRTVQRRRLAGGGPPFLRMGRRILYRVEDVEAYEAARHTSTRGSK